MNNCLYLLCLPGPFKKTLEQVEPRLYELGFTSVPQDLTQFFKAVSLFLSKGKTLTIYFDEVQNHFLEEKGELALFQRYLDEFKKKAIPVSLFSAALSAPCSTKSFSKSIHLYTGYSIKRFVLNLLGFMRSGMCLLIMALMTQNDILAFSACSAPIPASSKFSYSLIYFRQRQSIYWRKAGLVLPGFSAMS